MTSPRSLSICLSILLFTASASALTVTPSDDATLRDGTHSATPNGSGATLEVKSDGVGFNREALLKFSFTGYTGSQCGRALLRLSVASAGTDVNRTLKVYGMASDTWSETSVTWDNGPATTTNSTQLDFHLTSGLTYEADVTAMVNGQMSDKVITFTVTNEGAATANGQIAFHSRTATNLRPQLVIQAPRRERLAWAMAMCQGKTPGKSGVWSWWNYGSHEPLNKNAAGRRDVATPFYPSVGPFDHSDAVYQEYTCQQMKLAGIDGISHHLVKYDTDPWRVAALQQHVTISQRYGLHGCARGGDFGQTDGVDWGTKYKQWIDLFAPVRYLVGGTRPLHMFFSLDPAKIDAAEVIALKNRFPANAQPYFMQKAKNAAADFTPWAGAIEGAYDWIGWSGARLSTPNYTDPATGINYVSWVTYAQAQTNYATDITRAKQALAAGDITRYAEGMSPGFDDAQVNGWGAGKHRVVREQGGSYLLDWRWQQCHSHAYDMVVLPTWDDFCEGSVFQPTVEFGTVYLSKMRSNLATWKGRPAPSGDLQTPIRIYKLRKVTTNSTVQTALDFAGRYIAQGNATAAEAIIAPYVTQYGVDAMTYFDAGVP